jgi:uncharacterized membrane-anchored protein
MEYQRRVVCAANRNAKGVTVLGARHHDAKMNEHIRLFSMAGVEGPFREQGFIDQHGVFMTRGEAWIVAQAAGQIIRRVGGDDSNGGTLYSENLY